ncbi:MAG TPA: dodecin [Candidatus Bathyarchaeia archaeon]|nr:dodecin [Candidatus Bathyarchaeia archaeon]
MTVYLTKPVGVKDLVWKCIEIVGESPESFANAVRNAITEAGKSVKHMQWFEVTSLRGSIQEGKVSQFQASVKIGFKVER